MENLIFCSSDLKIIVIKEIINNNENINEHTLRNFTSNDSIYFGLFDLNITF